MNIKYEIGKNTKDLKGIMTGFTINARYKMGEGINNISIALKKVKRAQTKSNVTNSCKLIMLSYRSLDHNLDDRSALGTSRPASRADISHFPPHRRDNAYASDVAAPFRRPAKTQRVYWRLFLDLLATPSNSLYPLLPQWRRRCFCLCKWIIVQVPSVESIIIRQKAILCHRHTLQ